MHYLEMSFRNDRRGSVAHPDGYGKRIGECGDTVKMYLSISNGRIRAVAYETDGCMNTNACANTVAEPAEGRKVADAWEITPEGIVTYLATLPPENTHCAELAVGALYLALTNWQEFQRRPYMRLYQGK